MAELEQKQQEQVKESEQDGQEKQKPVFQEIENMEQNQAVEVLIQAAQIAQNTGKLSVRDSTMLAKAIDLLRPGTI